MSTNTPQIQGLGTIERVLGDDLINMRVTLEKAIRAYQFPRLSVETVTDDGETYQALRCVRCGELIGGDELTAVSPAEHWANSEDLESDLDNQRQRVTFVRGDNPDLEETLYYFHGDHAVGLPEGWSEGEWV